MATEDVVIVPYRDGPYLVRGPLVLRDQDGRRIELSRRTVALCRCGKSRMRPFCDGTHRLVEFRAPSQPEAPRGDPSEPPTGSTGHSTDTHSPEPAEDRAAAALSRLRLARTRIAALIGASRVERGHLALGAALPLIDGACQLLEQSRPTDAQPPLAALHLVKGALDALGDAVCGPEQGLTAATSELVAAAVALEPRGNGSWRS